MSRLLQIVIVVWFVPLTASAVDESLVGRSKVACPVFSGKPVVVGIGSSTMKGSLGPSLRRVVKRQKYNISFEVQAKSASGLARPDYYDWPARVRELKAEKKPAIWLVAIGTNDYQSVRISKGKWYRFPSKAWKEEYGRRVREMLELMSGPRRESAVVYIGSTAFRRKNSRRMGPALNAIIREQIEQFDGPAIFYDAFRATSDDKNRARKTFQVPGKRARYNLFGPDGIHLTPRAVRHVLAEPAMRLVLDCAAGKK